MGSPPRSRTFAQAATGGSDLILTRVVAPGELTPDALSKSRVVVLANVRQLADSQVAALASFVASGGGLLVFPGNRINTDWYHRTLRAAGLRAQVDDGPDRMGAKIRQAQLQKVPYMFVVGDREAEQRQVSVRTRAGGDLGATSTALLVGVAASFLSGLVALRILFAVLNGRSTRVFVAYRLVFAAVLVATAIARGGA